MPPSTDLARRELAPLALHSYMEAFADFKHCMLALVSGAAAARPAGGSGGAPHGAPPSELQDFAGVVVRGVRQERRKAAGGGGGGGEPGPAAAPAAACPPLSLLLRYLLLLHQHQHHSGFHPHWQVVVTHRGGAHAGAGHSLGCMPADAASCVQPVRRRCCRAPSETQQVARGQRRQPGPLRAPAAATARPDAASGDAGWGGGRGGARRRRA